MNITKNNSKNHQPFFSTLPIRKFFVTRGGGSQRYNLRLQHFTAAVA
jgi:hypothetical protein